MTPIIQAAAQGYSEDDILKFISGMFPKVAPRISKAARAGYTSDQILRYVNSMMEDEKFPKGTTPNQIHAAHTERLNKNAKKILGTAATAVGTAAFVGKLPKLVNTLLPNIGPKPMSNAPTTSPQLGDTLSTNTLQNTPQSLAQAGQQTETQPLSPNISSQQPQNPPLSSQNVLSSPAAQQPAPIEQYRAESKKKAESIITELGIDKTLKNVSLEGKNLEQISKEVIASLSPDQKKAYQEKRNKGEAKPMVAMLKDYFGQAEGETGLEQPEVSQGISEPSLAKEAEIEPEKMQKGSIVATPDGLAGEVRSIRNGQALVEDSGKLHKVKVSDLQLPDEHIASTVARILEMPEADKSSVLNYWAYDPEDNELFIMYHNGETYRYKEVEPELVKELEEAATAPKTKGENAFGAWSQEDKQSRGATAIKTIIANAKYKKPKKGDPINPYYRKLKKGYDYWQKLRK